jgi:calcineurin-like phosphoesterase family protein
MSEVLFIGDLHFGHINMAKHRGFDIIEEHDEFIIDQWNKRVSKKDVIYILGDIAMETSKHYHLLDRLKGLKNVVLGNHDMPKDVPELMKHVNKVAGMIKHKGIWLTHCPVHPRELQFGVKHNIHGHIHEHIITEIKYDHEGFPREVKDERYKCVSCEHTNYAPVSLVELNIER